MQIVAVLGTLTLGATLTACAHSATRVAPAVAAAPTVAATSTGSSSPSTSPLDPVGRYDLAFVMQGSPVDMVLRIGRGPSGELTGITRTMGVTVAATRVARTDRGVHIDLDPSVSGEGSIDLIISGTAVTGTLTWLGQPTKMTGTRLP